MRDAKRGRGYLSSWFAVSMPRIITTTRPFQLTPALVPPTVGFCRPLDEGRYFKPAAAAPETGGPASAAANLKPLLLYLPGFGGSLLAPFLQYFELGTSFEVTGMRVSMADRSTFDGLAERVVGHVLSTAGGPSGSGSVCVLGESFGGQRNARASTSPRSTGFRVIWDCTTSSSSSTGSWLSRWRSASRRLQRTEDS